MPLLTLACLTTPPPSPIPPTGEFFCRLILEDHAFYDFSVTELGAASIATARYVLAVGPIWPPALEERTGYSQALLTPCIQAILRYAAKRFPNKFVDVANAMSPKLVSA